MLSQQRPAGGRNDLFRARLTQIVDLNHALAKLGRQMNWAPSPQALRGTRRHHGLSARVSGTRKIKRVATQAAHPAVNRNAAV